MLTLEKQREKPEGLRILMGWYQHLKLISSQGAEEGGISTSEHILYVQSQGFKFARPKVAAWLQVL